MIKRPFVWMLAFLLSACWVFAKHPKVKQLRLGLDASLEQSSTRPFNGHILVCKGKRVLYEKVGGYQDFDTQSALTSSQAYILGSVSKQMTAVLVLQALEAGKLQLNQSLHAFFPQAKCKDLHLVTIHHLLNHTSGIDGLDKDLKFSPGSQFAYSNDGYNLLGQILEQIHGRDLDLVAKDLFNRYGLSGLTTVFAKEQSKFARGWMRDSTGKIQAVPQVQFPKSQLASALFVGDAKSLAAWNRLLHHGNLLQASSYQAMTSPSSTRNHPIFGNVDYGYGIQMTQVDGLKELSHGGYVEGFACVNFYYPAQDISLVVLENLDWMDPSFQATFWHPMRAREVLRKWILSN